MAKKGKLSGKTKAAILLIALGPEHSAKLFSHMHDDEIEELTLEIANVNRITPEEREEVLDEFYQVCLAQEFITEGGINYAKEVLEKAMGSQKALEIINKLTSSLQVKPFDFVKKTDANQLLNFIQNEHPQNACPYLVIFESDSVGASFVGIATRKTSRCRSKNCDDVFYST